MSKRGHCILSHGFESGPDATKVTALAEAAQRLGWSHERPDYTDLDAKREASELGDVPARLQRLLALAGAAAARGPLVLAGSSLGAWISGRVTLEVPVTGLFLMAPPVRMAPPPALEAAAVPTSTIHGWDDELIPPPQVVAWGPARAARLMLLHVANRRASTREACGEASPQQGGA